MIRYAVILLTIFMTAALVYGIIAQPKNIEVFATTCDDGVLYKHFSMGGGAYTTTFVGSAPAYKPDGSIQTCSDKK